MPGSTSRLLDVLEALEGRSLVTGAQLAERLGVDRRTVRRYVTALEQLGFPVEGERGVGGGYRLRPGFRLPPLMLTDDEATVVVLGLLAAGRLGLDSSTPARDGALAKIHRVLPEELRRRVEALEETLSFTAPAVSGSAVPGDVALDLAGAIRRGRRVAIRYRAFDGAETERTLSPYGVVIHSGRWYLAAYDHGRRALRTFRVDRILDLEVLAAATRAAPNEFAAVEHVRLSLARIPWPWEIEVWLGLPLEDARRRLPTTVAELTSSGDGTTVVMRVDSLDWAAGVLAGLGCAFTMVRPDELRASLHELAARLTAAAA